MKLQVMQLKSLTVGLQELEPFIKDPKRLRNGRKFTRIEKLPQELLANWLLCAVGNGWRHNDPLVVQGSADPLAGDGISTDTESDQSLFTEHVYVRPEVGADAGELIVRALSRKAKRGKAYAKGKSFVIFNEADGYWSPSKVARQIAGTHHFDSVWVIGLEAVYNALRKYRYHVTELNSSAVCPICVVKISDDFKSWTVDRIQ
jgi:hypothetical protein